MMRKQKKREKKQKSAEKLRKDVRCQKQCYTLEEIRRNAKTNDTRGDSSPDKEPQMKNYKSDLELQAEGFTMMCGARRVRNRRQYSQLVPMFRKALESLLLGSNPDKKKALKKLIGIYMNSNSEEFRWIKTPEEFMIYIRNV